jgi:predicted DNA-binding transcriptional regulator YafY
MDLLEKLGNSQLHSSDLKTLIWMLTQLSTSNTLRTSQRAMAEHFGVRHQTIQQRIARLKQAGLIVWVYVVREGAGHYRVDPDLCAYGSTSARRKARAIFDSCLVKQMESMAARSELGRVELDDEDAAPTLEATNLSEAA